MNRTRALIFSVAVALVAVTGAYALSDTLAIGKQTNATTDQEVAKRTAQLNSFETSLHKALEEQPPVLPAAPKVATTGASDQLAAGTPPRVVYNRPAPIVMTDDRAGNESEYEGREHDEGDDDDGDYEDTKYESGEHQGDDDDD
jgi:hypothetical protein